MISRYPEEIEKLVKIFDPYGKKLYEGKTENVLQEAIDAYKKVRKWAWEQGR